jgi:protein-S-isoprenylcysteine O-methyltransferase Ste14
VDRVDASSSWPRSLGIRLVVIPAEESALIAHFGDRYRDYMKLTGRLLPSPIVRT